MATTKTATAPRCRPRPDSQIRRSAACRELPKDYGRTEPCPVCGGPSIYVPAHDRYFHADGGNNRQCWEVISTSGLYLIEHPAATT
jgi:hypothetical protein